MSDTKERIPYAGSLELRVEPGKPPIIEGYAAVFNQLSEPLGGFREQIKPGAFKASLSRGDDVRALVDHDPSKILGRSTSGTLSLKEDQRGLRVKITPPDTTVGRDIIESVRRGDVDQMSFGFITRRDEWEFSDEPGGLDTRTLLEVDLMDVSAVTFPAYPQTSAQVRSLYESTKSAKKRSRELIEQFVYLTTGLRYER